MTLSLADLQRIAGATGFRAETLEKVLLLLDLLDAIRAHPFAGPRVVLKGGTALNLFTLDAPRLSVDIDLNYVGAVDRVAMETERPDVERGLQAACARSGLTVKRVPTDHAGGKWRLSFVAAAGGTAALELDVNYMLRSPLWPVIHRQASALPGVPAHGAIPVLDPHELAAGKLAALLARGASRDFFDARESCALASSTRRSSASRSSCTAERTASTGGPCLQRFSESAGVCSPEVDQAEFGRLEGRA